MPACNKTDCRKHVTGEEIRLFPHSYLYSGRKEWAQLGTALAELIAGNTTRFQAFDDVTNSESTDFAAQTAMCLDWSSSTTIISDILVKQQLLESIAPHTKGPSAYFSSHINCIGWPVPPKNPPHRLQIAGVPHMLMLNALYDPATPWTWALSVQGQIPGSVLVLNLDSGLGSTFCLGVRSFFGSSLVSTSSSHSSLSIAS